MSELYIPIERPQYNPTNGQFLKGHIPFNKGKKWEDYMDMRKARRIKRIAIKNLVRNRNIGGWNKRAVVCVDEENNILGWFSSSYDAEKKTGIWQETSDKLVMASGNTQVDLNGYSHDNH